MQDWETKIDNIPLKSFESFENKYDYVACFDENGSSSAIIQMFKTVMSGKQVDENRRYFTLTCVLFSKDNYEFSKGILTKLKRQYFKVNPESVVLHTRDINKKLGPFNFGTETKYKKFLNSLTNSISLIKCKIISVTFDLYSYIKQNYKHDPYEVAFDIILNLLCKNVKKGSKTALVFESRGKEEDRKLYKHIYKIINVTGCKHLAKRIIQDHFDEAFFNRKLSSDKSFAYPGIEIADLCSYPIYRLMRFEKEGRDFEVVKDKIIKNKDGKLIGMRKFPNNWSK